MTGRRVISDLGFAALILIVAVGTGILAEIGRFGPWVKGELKTIALGESVVALWALTRALLLQQARRWEALSPWNHPEGISQTTGLTVATLGLLTAILNLFGAILSLRKTY
jgi:hypothetical protein